MPPATPEEAGFEDGSIRPVGPARVIAYGIIGMVNWTHRWYREGASGMPSAAEIAQSFNELVRSGLAPGPSAVPLPRA